MDGPIVAVRDLESRNGVFVDGQRHADAPIEIGDVIRCGEWIGVVVCEEGEGAAFTEIAPGWHGGATLSAAIEPARHIASDLPIVVQGETGTGKEGIARALHDWSRRRGPLVAVNCAALPSDLAEAELFGYRKGAFTGADTNSPGLFRAAEGGSIFLDEILELPLTLQAKLLRVLEDSRVRGLGETRDTPAAEGGCSGRVGDEEGFRPAPLVGSRLGRGSRALRWPSLGLRAISRGAADGADPGDARNPGRPQQRRRRR